MNLTKRRFIKVVAGIMGITPLAQAGLATAQTQKESEPPKPYKELSLKILGDKRSVKVFFQYSCPYCANYFSGLDGWGKTLPLSWKFEWVPIVASTNKEEIIPAMAYYAALQTDRSKISLFSLHAYDAIAAQRKSITDPNTWIAICKACAIPEKPFMSAFKKVSPSLIQATAKECARYQISETPSVAIGGAYIVTPNNSNGNADLFYQLLNGMVSKAMA